MFGPGGIRRLPRTDHHSLKGCIRTGAFRQQLQGNDVHCSRARRSPKTLVGSTDATSSHPAWSPSGGWYVSTRVLDYESTIPRLRARSVASALELTPSLR